MKKTASLAASLIATKGEAVPIKTAVQGANDSNAKRTAITVKILENPYLRMKAYGAANRVSNQDMLEEALNDYLVKVGA